jgi:purine-binding chemotaxis protein CheW
MGALIQLLAFELSARRLALPVELVETIVWAVRITPLPHAPPFVEGLINLRGRVVPVVDLRRRFGLATVPLALEQRFVVVRNGHRTLALRVDRVDAVVTVEPEAVERAERVVPGARHAAALVRLPDGVLVIQDLEALLSSEDGAQLDEAIAAGPLASEPGT